MEMNEAQITTYEKLVSQNSYLSNFGITGYTSTGTVGIYCEAKEIEEKYRIAINVNGEIGHTTVLPSDYILK